MKTETDVMFQNLQTMAWAFLVCYSTLMYRVLDENVKLGKMVLVTNVCIFYSNTEDGVGAHKILICV